MCYIVSDTSRNCTGQQKCSENVRCSTLISCTVITVVNWCGQWFEYFPNPPLNVLAMVENLLAHHDAELLEHFVRHSITTQVSPSAAALLL